MRKIVLYIVASVLFIPTSSYAQSNEGSIPIPQKRPQIVNVSPSYVEFLKQRALKDAHSNKKPSQEITENDKNKSDKKEIINHEVDTVSLRTAEKTELDEDGAQAEIINRAEILKILGGGSVKKENSAKIISFEQAPIPPKKPLFKEKEVPVQILPETTLVSFSLEPEQVELNDELRNFLKNYALELFKEDMSVRMEIQAYATKISDQAYSDVRLSLARALEVRTFLIDNNVSPSRLKIIPLGENTENEADDRIDLILLSQK